MKKLLKQYYLNSDMQYFEMIVDAYKIGQKGQAELKFKALPKGEKKNFVLAASTYWNSGLKETDIYNFALMIK